MFMVSHFSIHDHLSPDFKMMELRRMKGSIMVQWINLLQNNRSVLRMVSTSIVLKTGHIHLVLVGLTAGRVAVHQAVSPSDKNL